jgi:hypothetical protein
MVTSLRVIDATAVPHGAVAPGTERADGGASATALQLPLLRHVYWSVLARAEEKRLRDESSTGSRSARALAGGALRKLGLRPAVTSQQEWPVTPTAYADVKDAQWRRHGNPAPLGSPQVLVVTIGDQAAGLNESDPVVIDIATVAYGSDSARAINEAVEGSPADWISVVRSGDTLSPGAMGHLVARAQHSGADVVYADEDCRFGDVGDVHPTLRTPAIGPTHCGVTTPWELPT